jgi:hypothetical protein
MLKPPIRPNMASGSRSVPSRQLSLPQPPAGILTSRADASSTFPPQRTALPSSGAPPVSRPRPVLGTGVQPKPVRPASLETRPAPPVYRPGLVPGTSVQPKPVRPVPLETRPAPPVFNAFPNSRPLVGLLKPTASVRATAPAIYHPAQDSALQSKARPSAFPVLTASLSKNSAPGPQTPAAPTAARFPGSQPPVVQRMQTSAADEEVTFIDDFVCDTCDRIVRLEVSEGGEHFCPHCSAHLKSLPGTGVRTCKEQECSNYMKQVLRSGSCEGNRNGNECKKPLFLVTPENVDQFPVTATAQVSESKAVRKLKATLQKAQSYVDSSGSHHKSTSGRHGSRQVEQHSSAHKAKKRDREGYIEKIQGLLADSDIPASLQREANEMIGKLKNK